MIELAEGGIQGYVGGLAGERAQVEAGRARLLAVTNSVRAAALPDVPTIAEAGFPPLTFDGLAGLFGRPELPSSVQERIADDVATILADPAVAARLNVLGVIANPGNRAAFAASLEAQREKLAAIARLFGIAAHRNGP